MMSYFLLTTVQTYLINLKSLPSSLSNQLYNILKPCLSVCLQLWVSSPSRVQILDCYQNTAGKTQKLNSQSDAITDILKEIMANIDKFIWNIMIAIYILPTGSDRW